MQTSEQAGFSLDRLFEGFLLAKEADGVLDTTLETYRVMYKSLVAALPAEQLEDAGGITTQHLQEWVVSLKRYANATRDQRISKAKMFFGWCQSIRAPVPQAGRGPLLPPIPPGPRGHSHRPRIRQNRSL